MYLNQRATSLKENNEHMGGAPDMILRTLSGIGRCIRLWLLSLRTKRLSVETSDEKREKSWLRCIQVWGHANNRAMVVSYTPGRCYRQN